MNIERHTRLQQQSLALLPTATKIASINAKLARAVEPYWAVIASVSAWEASLTARMARWETHGRCKIASTSP